MCNEVENGGEINVDSNLYGRQTIKQTYYLAKDGPFHGKCAYCECYLKDYQRGDMEHFRPKKGVTDEEDNPISRINGDGEEETHPGYYWLAYDWTNLLPACQICNQASKYGENKIGKHNRFPVVGEHAFDSESVADESPLLINPLFEDPAEHFDIDTHTGAIVGKTQKGEMCERVFGLNVRDRLPEGRRNAVDRMRYLMGQLKHDDTNVQSTIDELQDILAGKTEYSFAAREYFYKQRELINDLC